MSNELLKTVRVKRSLLLQDVPVTQIKGKWLISLSEQWLINICLFLFIRVNSLIDLQIFLSILFYSKTVTILVSFSPPIGNFFHCCLLLPWEGVAAETPFHKDRGALKSVCLEPVVLWDLQHQSAKHFTESFSQRHMEYGDSERGRSAMTESSSTTALLSHFPWCLSLEGGFPSLHPSPHRQSV